MASYKEAPLSRGNHSKNHPDISDLIDALTHGTLIVGEPSEDKGYIILGSDQSSKYFRFEKNGSGYQLTVTERGSS